MIISIIPWIYIALIVILILLLLSWSNDSKLIMPYWHYNWALYDLGPIRGDKYVREKQYTKLGNWVKKVPGVVSIPIMLPYYLVVWPIWVIYTGINQMVSYVVQLLCTPLI